MCYYAMKRRGIHVMTSRLLRVPFRSSGFSSCRSTRRFRVWGRDARGGVGTGPPNTWGPPGRASHCCLAQLDGSYTAQLPLKQIQRDRKKKEQQPGAWRSRICSPSDFNASFSFFFFKYIYWTLIIVADSSPQRRFPVRNRHGSESVSFILCDAFQVDEKMKDWNSAFFPLLDQQSGRVALAIVWLYVWKQSSWKALLLFSSQVLLLRLWRRLLAWSPRALRWIWLQEAHHQGKKSLGNGDHGGVLYIYIQRPASAVVVL